MTRSLGKAKKTRGKTPYTNKHKKSFVSIVENLVKEVDIVLEILDARFIEESRSREIEDKIKRSGKILIYVFNKADLADKNKIVIEKELQDFKPHVFFSSKDRKGSSDLRKLIKINAKKLNKEVINIGVIGYPNVGKSSLINLLAGRSAARTSSEAGHTKGIKKIKLSQGIYLIDTPGVIPISEKHAPNYRQKNSQIGAIVLDKIKDPDLVIDTIMTQYPGALEKYYGIEVQDNSETFLEEFGRRLNFLKKGNLVDTNRTAKKILRDWYEKKILV